jgi:hypothetical protein
MGNRRLNPCGYRVARSPWCSHAYRQAAGHGSHTGRPRPVRSTPLGNTTDTITQGITDAAGAVQHAVQQGWQHDRSAGAAAVAVGAPMAHGSVLHGCAHAPWGPEREENAHGIPHM